MPSTNHTLRLRVFAGPNGSGKSTIIEAVKNHKVKGIPVDFGIYINADDIAFALRKNKFSFSAYKIKATQDEFINSAIKSGLIGAQFTDKDFFKSFIWHPHTLTIKHEKHIDRVAQIIADFLRKKLVLMGKKLSFETVFSHPDKLEFMREAAATGYKVYLYFVCTESPEINKFRVKQVRVKEGGHDVPEDKIEARYYRSLELLFDAAQISYQTFFFDNSGNEFNLFANFKKEHNKKKWAIPDKSKVPVWFLKYYSSKVKHK